MHASPFLSGQDLEEDAVVIRVPESLQIRYDLIKDDPKLERLYSKLPSSDEGLSPAWQAKQALAVMDLQAVPKIATVSPIVTAANHALAVHTH